MPRPLSVPTFEATKGAQLVAAAGRRGRLSGRVGRHGALT
jgi:hypothetical protein